jgi:hypothetical protein
MTKGHVIKALIAASPEALTIGHGDERVLSLNINEDQRWLTFSAIFFDHDSWLVEVKFQ